MPSSLTLARFHDTLQIVMGWAGPHLHRFTLIFQAFGCPDYEQHFDENELPLLDEHHYRAKIS